MRLSMSKIKTTAMKAFSEVERGIADTKHFGRPSRWKERHSYIRAVEKGKIVGILHYSFKAGVMEIETIIVSHKHRREGIGKALVLKAEDIAKKKGLHKLFPLTGKGWEESKFYKKMGFIETGGLRKHYLGRDWVEFTKFLR